MGDFPNHIGQYRIVQKLGEGGMGVVFEALHEAIERRVAIKVLHPQYARNEELMARFFNEARAVNRIAHPGLVQVSDYGQQHDGAAYIVMEFLAGPSLALRQKQEGGKLPAAAVIHLGEQLADALAAAHAKGIVHRDLKPQNVMIVPDPQTPSGERTKLLDFGIAKITESGSEAAVRTKTNQVMGTPTYMSPEQCEGAGNVDDKSDVYSLGVMLFELLAGRPPFIAEGMGKVIGMHILVEPPLLSELAPEVPAPLAELVQRLLAKNKNTRPMMRQVAISLKQLAERYPLQKFANKNPASETAIPFVETKASTLGGSASQVQRQTVHFSRLRVAAGSAVLAVITVTAIVISSHPGSKSTAHAPAPQVAPAVTVPVKPATVAPDPLPAAMPDPPVAEKQPEEDRGAAKLQTPDTSVPAAQGSVRKAHRIQKPRRIYAKPPLEK